MSATPPTVEWVTAHRDAVLAKRADLRPIDHDAEAEIRDLLVNYTTCYDCQDIDGVLDVFAPDATYTTLLGTFRGRDELRGNYEALVAKFRRTAHLMLNQTIHVTSPTEARAFSYLHSVVELLNGAGYTLVGSYQDQLEKRDGRWYIVTRVVLDGISSKMRPLAAEDRLSQHPGTAW
jgi:uncharacterized protein (TIGR02246 family)